MPSIGGIDNSHTKDCGLDNVTTLISVELEGTKSLSSLKSQTIISPSKDKPIKTEATTMAPHKNGELDRDCKTSTQAISDLPEKQTQPDKNADARSAMTENVADVKDPAGCNGSVGKTKEVVEKDADSAPEKDDARDKSAEEKREEYKVRPRASSLELLGLKKTKNPIIRNQGYLDPKVCESAESELRRRKSSPGSYNFMRSHRIPEEVEDGSVDKLAGKMKEMELSGKKGFGERMAEERGKETDELVAKGIDHFRSNHRSQPYPTPQTAAGYMYAQQASQICNTMNMHQQAPQYGSKVQYIKPPTQRVAVPGSNQQKHFEVGRMDNRSHQQMSIPRREPEEQSWPQSPTDNSYPNSPGSVASLSPAHTMQQMPSPAYSTQSQLSPGYSPQYSPSMQPQPSPQSMMSPAESYQGMPVSPNSPLSPEMMNTIPSPPSVQSEDSGISSPPHNQDHRNHMPVSTRVGTNIGTVIDNSTRRLPESTINIEYLYSQNRQHTQLYRQHDQQQQNQNQNQFQKQHHSAEDEQNIQLIANQLMACEKSCNPQERIAIPPQQHHVHVNQGMMMRPHPVAFQGQQITMVPNQMQMGPMHDVYLQEEQVQINVAQTMRFDDLCSPDEDGDTALHIAVTQARTKLVEVIVNRLLSGGRKDALNLKDNLGQTPLYLAMVTNQPEMIILLVKCGADPMIPNKDQMTVLHYAANKGYSQALFAIFYCYVKNMIPHLQIDVEDRGGRSPLQCAVRAHGRLTRVYDGTEAKEVDKMVDSLDTIKRLLELEADPSFQDRKGGYTALHYAVELPPSTKVTHNTHIIKILLEAPGYDARSLLKMSNYAGNTPLHLIAGRDYDEDYVVRVIDHLISFGADIDVKNLERQSPRDLVTQKKSERPRVYSRLQGDQFQGK